MISICSVVSCIMSPQINFACEGSFFARYPRHDKLISINKRFTGKTNKQFNMRHDWNSLLSDDVTLLFKVNTIPVNCTLQLF